MTQEAQTQPEENATNVNHGEIKPVEELNIKLPETIKITGKQLGVMKRQLLDALNKQYQDFAQFLARLPGDENMRIEAFEHLDCAILDFQKAIIIMREMMIQPMPTQAQPETQPIPEEAAKTP